MNHASQVATIPSIGLSESELRSYRELGYAGPFPLFDDAAIENVLLEWDRTQDRLPWYKGHHVYQGPIVDALTSDAVVGRIRSVLGDDLMLWGSQVLAKKAGEVHRWHVDIETIEWKSVNLWAALRNVSASATVLLLPRTQRLKVSPQELERTEGLVLSDTAAVTRAARDRGIETDVVVLDIPPGAFVIFDGHLWHGSVNKTRKVRSALLAQFSPTSERAKIPRTYVPPIRWDPEPAPCLLVSGRDVGGANHYVTPVEPPPRRSTIFGVRRAVDHMIKRVSRPAAAAMRRQVSVCIVGTGGAADRHVAALRELTGVDVRISAVGRDPKKVASWVAERAATRGYRSIDEAMSAGDDIVVIATPPSSHASYIDAAMAAGKHVLVEKPAVRSLEELISRLPAIRAYERTFMVAENAHFSPMQRLVSERVRAGAIGEPLLVSIRRMRRRAPSETWKSLASESDGALHEGGVHWVRVGLALGGVRRPRDVEWVFAAHPGTKTIENHGDDTALVNWRLANGALGELTHSWGLEGGRLLLRSAVVGTEGALYFDVSGRFATISRGQRWAQRPLVPWRELRAREDLSGTTAMWRSFLESVHSGAPAAHTIEEAAADLGVIDAAYRAMTTNAAQPLDPRLADL